MKKTLPKKQSTAPTRISGVKPKRTTVKRKYILPAPETTVLEMNLEPGGPSKKSRRVRKAAAPKRALMLPGYVAFTLEVWRVIWKYKSTFWRLVIVYAILSGVFVGLASQSISTELSGLLRTTGGEIIAGDTSKISEASDLLLTSLTGASNPDVGEAQQLIGGLLVLMIWLTTVWLLRAFLAGRSPRLRDGFYNSGSPLVPTLLLSFVLIIQLIPAAIAAIAISAVMPMGLISGVIMTVLFWIVVLLLAVLSLYWVTSTLIALVVVTLPGMYPMKALGTARELVARRRLRIVLRMVWLLFISSILWALVMIPIIVFDAAIKGLWQAIEWLPIVPIAFLLVSSVTIVWMASYMYLLYRKVVDYDSESV